MAVAESHIEWTDSTWSPIIGCSRVSEGCRFCYAERAAIRQVQGRYTGLVKSTSDGPRWTGEVRLVEKDLDLPLRWRAPRRIFVNSMSDLFHEKVPDEWIALIWGVMMLAERHTFQVLTKRPERMRSWLSRMDVAECIRSAFYHLGDARPRRHNGAFGGAHIWLGVSVEDQKTADERIPLLLATPAAVRWVSYEPALGPVNFTNLKDGTFNALDGIDFEAIGDIRDIGILGKGQPERGLGWLVVGGESGPGARPFDLAWARSAIAQCRAAGIPVFLKQLGARPVSPEPCCAIDCDCGLHHGFRDRKGGDPAEWPEDLRVRDYPR